MPGTSRVGPTLRGRVGTLTRCLSVGNSRPVVELSTHRKPQMGTLTRGFGLSKACIGMQLIYPGISMIGAISLLLQLLKKSLVSHLLHWWSCCGI